MNEDYFNSEYKIDSENFDVGLGYYRNVYAGFVNNTEERLESSSGGLTSYLIGALFDKKLITGAIVVKATEKTQGRLDYVLVRNKTELRESKKSKYHMVSHDRVVQEILRDDQPERLIYVGIPCGVKAIKLLAAKNSMLKSKIKYTAAIFCGHQKSHAFSEYVAWQMGVSPSEFHDIDYRVKEEASDASKYFYQIRGLMGLAKKRVDRLKWMDWGLGLFKPKACEFCDDVAGETADIIFGDAWHKRYAKDYRGSNIVITRSAELERVLVAASEEKDITLIEEDVSLVYSAQGGNFRHRQEGLKTRLAHYKKDGKWCPPKDYKRMSNYKLNVSRDAIYMARHKISMKSHLLFVDAKKRQSLDFFWTELEESVNTYYKKSITLRSRIKLRIKSAISKYC
jgi:coenzyme F420-reducing hydrogenase beta subunit